MMRDLSTVLILCLYFISDHAFANEDLIPYHISYDPFAMPVMQKKTVPDHEAEKQADVEPSRTLKLFSTLRSTKRSMANVSGRILKIGEIIDGYRLITVNERSVILIKNQQRTRLTLDDTYE